MCILYTKKRQYTHTLYWWKNGHFLGFLLLFWPYFPWIVKTEIRLVWVLKHKMVIFIKCSFSLFGVHNLQLIVCVRHIWTGRYATIIWHIDFKKNTFDLYWKQNKTKKSVRKRAKSISCVRFWSESDIHFRILFFFFHSATLQSI